MTPRFHVEPTVTGTSNYAEGSPTFTSETDLDELLANIRGTLELLYDAGMSALKLELLWQQEPIDNLQPSTPTARSILSVPASSHGVQICHM